MCVSSVGTLPHRFFVQGTAVKKFKRSINAAIKPNAIAVATKCKGRRLKMGACSQLFKLALWGVLCTATDIAEA